MTTIAYKDGILAADTQVTCGTTRISISHKIKELTNGIIVACAGGVTDDWYFKRWLAGEQIPKSKLPTKKFEAMAIKDGKPYWYQDGMEDHPVEKGQFYAIGSGWNICMAFMHTGMSAVDAIKATSELDIYTNKRIDFYDTKRKKITYGK